MYTPEQLAAVKAEAEAAGMTPEQYLQKKEAEAAAAKAAAPVEEQPTA